METLAAAFPWEDLLYALLVAVTSFFGAHRGAVKAVNGPGKLK